MTKLLQFVEFDAEGCSLEYGVAPCQAGGENWFFQSSTESFAATNATFTSGTEYATLLATATDPQLRSPASLTLDGATNFIILLEIERLDNTGTWNGRVFYTTAGHGESASYFKEISEPAVGKSFIRLDMRELDAGGDDWIENEITRVRFDFFESDASEIRVYKVQIHPEHKCFNTLNTCQDRGNYDAETTTLRFAEATDYLDEAGIEAIPSIKSINFTPATLRLGESLGERASLSVSFEDHRHADNGPGYDKYFRERDYDAFNRGTYWGKFRARRPFVRGKSIRLIRGELGQTLEQMDTRHYLVESFDGPTPDLFYTLIAKDVLKFADDDRAQAPLLSPGFLVSGITDTDTSATLSPSGVGDTDYPASGKVAIGGEEICSFTRSGDVLTLTRAQNNTLAVAHDAQDRVQLVLEYIGEDPADILYDLLKNYAGIPDAYLPVTTWQTETASFLSRVYTAVIAEPTGVRTLVNELIEQAAMVVWWADDAQEVRMRILRAISTEASVFNRDNVLERSLKSKEEPQKRLSQVWTYYGQRNPLVPVDEENNYRSVLLTVDLEAESDYGSPGIKKIFSRWIAAFGATTADRLNDILISRFRDPPRTFQFDVFRYGDDTVDLAGGYKLTGINMQDATGLEALSDIQVTRVNHNESKVNVQAEEILITEGDAVDLTNRTIIIDSNVNDFDLRAVHDGIFPAPTGTESPAVTLTCIVSSGIIVGSTSNAIPAFTAGSGSDWPGTFTVNIDVKGRIQGKGGDGGDAGSTSVPAISGDDGGIAFYTRENVNMELNGATGELWGGGGGGGAATDGDGDGYGGGGGAGTLVGLGGANQAGGDDAAGKDGTSEAGGDGGSADPFGIFGGNGGDPGNPGTDGVFLENLGIGGAAGSGIDGVSFVTKTGTGDIRGPEVN